MKKVFFSLLMILNASCGSKNDLNNENDIPAIHIQTKKAFSADEFFLPLTDSNYGINVSMQKFDELSTLEGHENIRGEIFFACASSSKIYTPLRLACLIEMANKKFAFSEDKKQLIERFFYSSQPKVVTAAFWAVVQQPQYLPPLLSSDLYGILLERNDLPRELRARIWNIFLDTNYAKKNPPEMRMKEELDLSHANFSTTYLPRSAILNWAHSSQEQSNSLLYLLAK